MKSRRTHTLLSAAAVLITATGLLATATPATAKTTAIGTVANKTVRIGMSAPQAEWDTRFAEVGGVDARRIFGNLDTPDMALRLAKSEIAAGRMPILSFKVPNNDWAGAAAGVYDPQLRSLSTRLGALPGKLFVTIHHEPAKDGTAAAYAALQRHVLPILSPPSNVDAGVIGNGWWWSSAAMGLTDSEIAQWLPPSVLRLSEVVAADTYQAGTTQNPGESATVKIKNLSAWATRVGVKRLGIGEYNGLSAATVKGAGDAVLADPRYVFASIFNSSHNSPAGSDWTLTGDRITAFRNTVAASRAARAGL